MRKSILPSSSPEILAPLNTPYGTFQVREIKDLDTHVLCFQAPGGKDWSLLATHPNGHSCHELARRIIAVWKGEEGSAGRALRQHDYILDCGGTAKHREHILNLISSPIAAR